MKRIILLFVLIHLFYLGKTQELILNGGFELTNKCSELKARCSPVAWYSTSTGGNAYGYEKNRFVAKKGQRFSYIVVADVGKKEYIQTWLACPIEMGKKYRLSFWIRKTDKYKFVPFGIYFSNQFEASGSRTFDDLSQAQLKITEKDFNFQIRRKKWHKVSIEFTAPLNAEFMTIGNFDPFIPSMKEEIPKWHLEAEKIKYYLDNISLQPIEKANICSDADQRVYKIVNHHARHLHNKKPNLGDLKTINIPKKVNENSKDSIEKINTNVISTPTKDTKKVPEIITLPSVFFDFDKYEINEKYRQSIIDALIVLKDKKIEKLEIVGHTDNKGNDDYNRNLSLRRAETIEKLIVLHNFCKKELISVAGKGASEPKADNASEEGRQQNRRVEILIY